MKQHKWHKEIKAWADGAEIESQYLTNNYDQWHLDDDPCWNNDDYEFRIKPHRHKREIYWNETEEKYCSRRICGCGKYDEIIPNQTTIDAINEARQFKEPQYLYAFWNGMIRRIDFATEYDSDNEMCKYIGKIKLETEDE